MFISIVGEWHLTGGDNYYYDDMEDTGDDEEVDSGDYL